MEIHVPNKNAQCIVDTDKPALISCPPTGFDFDSFHNLLTDPPVGTNACHGSTIFSPKRLDGRRSNSSYNRSGVFVPGSRDLNRSKYGIDNFTRIRKSVPPKDTDPQYACGQSIITNTQRDSGWLYVDLMMGQSVDMSGVLADVSQNQNLPLGTINTLARKAGATLQTADGRYITVPYDYQAGESVGAKLKFTVMTIDGKEIIRIGGYEFPADQLLASINNHVVGCGTDANQNIQPQAPIEEPPTQPDNGNVPEAVPDGQNPATNPTFDTSSESGSEAEIPWLGILGGLSITALVGAAFLAIRSATSSFVSKIGSYDTPPSPRESSQKTDTPSKAGNQGIQTKGGADMISKNDPRVRVLVDNLNDVVAESRTRIADITPEYHRAKRVSKELNELINEERLNRDHSIPVSALRRAVNNATEEIRLHHGELITRARADELIAESMLNDIEKRTK